MEEDTNWGHLTNNNIKLYIHYKDTKKRELGPSLFWDVAWHWFVVSYRCFGTML
jgi:hypothetical protein